jgi:hypothetical protein
MLQPYRCGSGFVVVVVVDEGFGFVVVVVVVAPERPAHGTSVACRS